MSAGRPRGRKPYREQRGGHKRDSFTRCQAAMSMHTGGDNIGFVMDWLRRQDHVCEDGRAIPLLHHNFRESQEITTVMRGMNKLLNAATDYNKRQVCSIFVDAGFTRDSLRQFGVSIGERGAFRFFLSLVL